MSTVTAAVGWRVRYWLPAGHPGTATIATQLAKRGPLAGVMEEICLIDDAGRLATRMRAAGWTVTSATGDAEPRMEIFSPDRTLRWSGPFRGFDDAGANDTLMLDIVVLEKVARGEAVAPFVPAGCVTPLPRESTAARGPE